MTKEEYLVWTKTRGAVGEWKIEDCVAADRLIREETLKTAKQWTATHVPPPARQLFDQMISAYFGSSEVDEFLQQISAYPDWM